MESELDTHNKTGLSEEIKYEYEADECLIERFYSEKIMLSLDIKGNIKKKLNAKIRPIQRTANLRFYSSLLKNNKLYMTGGEEWSTKSMTILNRVHCFD